MSATPKMTEALLGRSSQQIQISLLPFPAISSSPILKAQAFDYCMDAINMHRTKFEFEELSSFISRQIPNGDGTALHQATELGLMLREAFFAVGNLQGTGFFDVNSRLVSDDELSRLPSYRPKNIAFAAFEATVDPAEYFPPGATASPIRPLLVPFRLALPQTTIDTSTGTERTHQTGTPRTRRTIADVTTNNAGTPTGIGTAAGSDTINDYTDEVIAKLSPIEVGRLTNRSTASSGLASPKFTIRSATATGTITTYAGDYGFLDSQEQFDRTFLIRTFHGEASGAACRKRINSFTSECQFSVFTQLLRLDYVGSSKRVDLAHINTLTSQMRQLKMTSNDKAQGITTTEELFSAFLRIATLLPNQAKTWGICIAHQYLAALTDECRSDMEDQHGFQLPDPSELLTKATQLSALRDMRTAATEAQQRLDKSFKQHQQFMITYNKSTKKAGAYSSTVAITKPAATPDTGTPAIPASFPTTTTLLSPAEGVIRQHSTSSQIQHAPPVSTTTTPNGTFPTNPTTGFVSKFTLDFRGCLGCGEMSHTNFRQCPQRDDIDVKKEFFQELHAHKPKIRIASEQRRAAKEAATTSQPGSTTTTATPTPQHTFATVTQTNPTLNNHAAVTPGCQPHPGPFPYYQPYYNHLTPPTTTPLWLPPIVPTTLTAPTAPLPTTPPSDNDPNKKPRYYVITAKSCSAVSGSPLPPMPIAIDNGFPNITIDLGQPQDQFSITGLFDTCGSLNTGYLPFHAWIASTSQKRFVYILRAGD